MTTTFQKVRDIHKPEYKENLRDSVIQFVDWGFLNMGSYYNIEIPTSGTFGGDAHILRPVIDPNYTNGQVWEGFRQNWIWESGVNSSYTQPIGISGIFVDNSFLPYSSGYFIDYPNGRVIFDTARSTSSTVHLAYSFKLVNVMDARNVSWFKKIQDRSFRVDDSNFQAGSGAYSELTQTRLQLPAIIVEIVDNRQKEGYEIGSAKHWVRSDVIFHIMAEDDSYASRLADILDKQQDQKFFLFDSYIMNAQSKFPLDYRGEKTNNPLTYPDLIRTSGNGGARYEDIAGGFCEITNSTLRSGNWIHRSVYHQIVRWTTEAIFL